MGWVSVDVAGPGSAARMPTTRCAAPGVSFFLPPALPPVLPACLPFSLTHSALAWICNVLLPKSEAGCVSVGPGGVVEVQSGIKPILAFEKHGLKVRH